MNQPQFYEIGSRVRLTCDCAGSRSGEEGKIVQIKRDEQGNIISMDILLDRQPETTCGTTVYLREVEPVVEEGEHSLKSY